MEASCHASVFICGDQDRKTMENQVALVCDPFAVADFRSGFRVLHKDLQISHHLDGKNQVSECTLESYQPSCNDPHFGKVLGGVSGVEFHLVGNPCVMHPVT